jgi:hypothetical protein
MHGGHRAWKRWAVSPVVQRVRVHNDAHGAQRSTAHIRASFALEDEAVGRNRMLLLCIFLRIEVSEEPTGFRRNVDSYREVEDHRAKKHGEEGETAGHQGSQLHWLGMSPDSKVPTNQIPGICFLIKLESF